eukprot:jgi/Mesvir1/29275/Mv22376-RA.1
MGDAIFYPMMWLLRCGRVLVGHHLLRADRRSARLRGYYLTAEEIGAQQSLEGQRPALPSKWPTKIKQLLTSAWADDATLRPSASEIVQQLDEMMAQGIPEEPLMRAAANKQGCLCIVM